MDLCVCDVTDCNSVEVGAEAVVIGTQGGETIGVAEISERVGTIPWEILCGIGRRVPRVHHAGHDVVAVSSPLPPVKEVAMGPDPAKAGGKPKKNGAESEVTAPTRETGQD